MAPESSARVTASRRGFLRMGRRAVEPALRPPWALDEALFTLAQETSREADVFFIVGTSGIVYPAADLAHIAKHAGAMVVEVNPGETSLAQIADHSVRASASDFLPSLCEALRKRR